MNPIMIGVIVLIVLSGIFGAIFSFFMPVPEGKTKLSCRLLSFGAGMGLSIISAIITAFPYAIGWLWLIIAAGILGSAFTGLFSAAMVHDQF